ncbi:MAG: RHS repeat-associated core domain-containing protein [Acutalibacteraceae bacterium]
MGSVVDTISYTYDGTWKDKLVSFGGKALTYDAIGNPLTYDGYTFDWNGRILNSITGNSKTLNFKYNENGLRTEKKVTQNSITTTYSYIWHDQKLVSQSDGTNTFYFFYNDSKYAPDGFVLNGTDNYLYTKNLQGDITGIADSNGSIVTTYTYDAWGKIISVTGSQSTTIGTANPFRYRGYYYDTETELYYLQSRYYNPEWDRFLNADSTDYLGYGGFVSYNLFAYCENNPVSYFDYYGSFKGVYHYESTRDIAKKIL